MAGSLDEALQVADLLGERAAAGLDRLVADPAEADLVQTLALYLRDAMVATGDAELERRVARAVAGARADGAPGRILAALLRAMALRDATGATEAVNGAAEALAAGILSRPSAQYVFQGVNHAVWSNHYPVANGAAHDLAMRRLWRAILADHRAALPSQPIRIPRRARRPDLVMLMTGQFMDTTHQPSIDLLEFARLLATRFGKRVAIVNTADGAETVEFPLLYGYRANHDERLPGRRSLSFDGLELPFLHLAPGLTPTADIVSVMEMVREQRPSLIFSFGTANPAADLCAGLVDVVAVPFGTYLPVAEPTFVALPRPVTPADLPALELAGVPPERVVPIFYGYSLPPTGPTAERAALGVPEDALAVAIVGLRLDREVTPEFAAALEAMLLREPRLFFLFVGPFGAWPGLAARLPALAARAAAPGMQGDVRAVLRACDLYLNPPRGGGGASAAYALAEGVPAFTLPTGDVGVVAGERFHLGSLEDFPAIAARIADDPAERAAWAGAARSRYAEISSREEMLRQILDGVAARADD
ncbi:MAG TPA: hypothetical protein VED40_18495 [Azospirillaceae bacterium]|nr:hypothetical protein [Azospirillaceae bacterium]